MPQTRAGLKSSCGRDLNEQKLDDIYKVQPIGQLECADFGPGPAQGGIH